MEICKNEVKNVQTNGIMMVNARDFPSLDENVYK